MKSKPKNFRSNAIYAMIAYIIAILQRGFGGEASSEELTDICRAIGFKKVIQYNRKGAHRTFGDALGFNLHGLRFKHRLDENGVKIYILNMHDLMVVLHNIAEYFLERIGEPFATGGHLNN